MSEKSKRQRIRQLRVVVEAEDYDAAVQFYRDVLGMDEIAAFSEGGDDRVAILEAGRATLEIASPAHKVAIDRVEADGIPSPRIRIAFEVDDAEAVTRESEAAGAAVVAEPVLTPWQSLNSRLDAPAGLTITLFEETEESHERRSKKVSASTHRDRLECRCGAQGGPVLSLWGTRSGA